MTGWESFEPWINRIEAFSESLLWPIAQQVPPEWYDHDQGELDRLLSTLLDRRRKVRDLILEFKNSSRNPFPNWRSSASFSEPPASHQQHLSQVRSTRMRLRRNEYCPIHRSLFCCGREQAKNRTAGRLGVQRIEDPHHPRGYRELRSPAEMRKLLNRKVAEQGGNAESATKHSPNAAKSSPIISSQEEWEPHDGTIIRTTSRLYIDGATDKRGRKG